MVVDVFVVGILCFFFFEINNILIVEIFKGVEVFGVIDLGLLVVKGEDEEEDFEKMIVM